MFDLLLNIIKIRLLWIVPSWFDSLSRKYQYSDLFIDFFDYGHYHQQQDWQI